MREEAIELLQSHDLQVTAQRLAVMRAVHDCPHSTAQELADMVREEIGTISRQSVYDTLAVLTERGVLRRIQPSGPAALFEARTGDNHHHLVCRVCGRVVDVDCAAGDAPCVDPVQYDGFVVDEAEITYRGVCSHCRSAEAEPTGRGTQRATENAEK